MMFEEIGLLKNIRMGNISASIVQFDLMTLLKSFNCIAVEPKLVKKIAMFPDGKYLIKAEGEINSNKQLVISNFSVINSDNTAKLLLN